MNLIRRVKQTAARGLENLALLLQTYQTVLGRAPEWYQQIVKGLTQRVLDSTEIKNATSYAQINADDLLTRVIGQSEELLKLENSPMTVLTIYRRASYSALKENILLTLKEHSAPAPETGWMEWAGPSPFPPRLPPRRNSSLITLGDIATAIGNLADPILYSLGALILGPLFLVIMINIIIGATLGGNLVLLIDIFFIIAAALTVYLATQSSARWTLADENVDDLVRTVITPFVREQVNVELRRAHLEDSFHITIAPGLIELSDRDQMVETATMRRLRTLLNTMTYGSIGVSGARGTGKSVLLRVFCDERLGRPDIPELGILTSAPVDYDGRDFILHLFSILCLKVINLADTSDSASSLRRLIVRLCQIGVVIGGCLIAAEAGVKLSRAHIGFGERALIASIAITAVLAILAGFTGVRFPTRAQHQTLAANDIRPASGGSIRGRRIAQLITVAVIIIMAIGVAIFLNSKFYISPHSFIKSFPETKRFWPGATVLASALCIGIAISVIAPMRKIRHPRNIADQAREYLRRIESIRTVTTGQSAAIGLGGNRIQLNRSKASQLTERDLTLPAIVDLYRDFTANVVAWWQARHGGLGRIVIGIDELDKIANTESAERFINEIKAVFGIRNCLYIISTSEDALLQFEKKSLGFRSAFDSAFDDIIRVHTFSPADTHEVLLRRLAGIGDPFIVLCHIFSAGLSRDVLRTARVIVEARCSGLVSLKEICEFLISREIADLKKGLLAAHASWSTSEHRQSLESALVDALMDDRWPGTDSQELLSAATPSLRNGSPEMHTALCFLATVYDIAVRGNGEIWEACFVPGIIQDAIDDLARARNWLSSDPDVAVELVRAARSKLRLEPIG